MKSRKLLKEVAEGHDRPRTGLHFVQYQKVTSRRDALIEQEFQIGDDPLRIEISVEDGSERGTPLEIYKVGPACEVGSAEIGQ